MQQKLDTLCELVNNSKEYSTTAMENSCDKDGELQLNETFGIEKVKLVDCGCWHCEQHSASVNEVMVKNFIVSFCRCSAIAIMRLHNVSNWLRSLLTWPSGRLSC